MKNTTDKKTILSAEVPLKTFQYIKTQSKKHDITVSQIMRRALKNYFPEAFI